MRQQPELLKNQADFSPGWATPRLDKRLMLWPSNNIWPSLGSSSRKSSLSKVDFPAPLGPLMNKLALDDC